MIATRLIYIALLIGSVFFYILYIDKLSFYLMVFLFAIPIVFGVINFSIRKKLKFSVRSFESFYSKDEEIPIILSIENKSIIPVSYARITLEYQNENFGKTSTLIINTPILPKDKQDLRLEISSAHCGNIRVNITRIRVFDPILLSYFTLKKPKLSGKEHQTEFLVVPEIRDLNIELETKTVVDYESDTFSKNKSGDDPSEIFDMHEYKPGDKINRIHWKLTAKQDVMFVKEYSLPINNSICLIIDHRRCSGFNDEENASATDTLLEALDSVSAFLCENEIPHKIIFSQNNENTFEKMTVEETESLGIFNSRFLKAKITVNDSYSVINDFLSDNTTNRQYRILYFTAFVSDEELYMLSDYSECGNVTVIRAFLGNFKNAEHQFDDNIEFIDVVPNKVAESIDYLKI